MDLNDDVDVASLVVALMSPFEDRITALELQMTQLRSEICDCVTLDDFEELKSSVESLTTRQKVRNGLPTVVTADPLRASRRPRL